MPARVGHKKSRTGCQRCKARKVKCDEARPACSDCSRHQRPCIYQAESVPNSNSPKSNTDAVSTGARAPVSGPTSPYTPEPFDDATSHDRRRVLELLLLHHFTSVTATTFPSHNFPDISRVWMEEIVHDALEHSYLLNAIFALSALHLALVPTKRTGAHHDFDFARTHRIYLNLAVHDQRDALSHISKTNALALSYTSLLVNIMSIRLLPDQSRGEPYAPPVQWLAMSSAIRTVAIATAPFLQEGGIQELLNATRGPDFADPSAIFDTEYSEPFRSVMNCNDGLEVLDAEAQTTYDQALAYVSKVHQAISKPEEPHQICRRILALGPMLPHRFVTLVVERRPRALVIVAQHLSMAKSVKEYWWFQGTAEREVHGIRKILPQNWQWAMDWPLHILTNLS